MSTKKTTPRAKQDGADKHARPLLALRALRLLVQGPQTYASLGQAFSLSRSAVDRLLAALGNDGVEVTREPNPDDARHVVLTVARAAALKALGLES